jgi:uncharacterized OB-fold protein
MSESSERPTRRVPIEPGFFTIPAAPTDNPKLLGCRCRACGECFYPRRIVCARCLAEHLEEIELGPRGTLYTYTYVHVPLFGSLRSQVEGYGVGQVDLPEGPRVQAVLSGGPEDFRIGMPMELELETLRVTADGDEVTIYRFRPCRDEEAK